MKLHLLSVRLFNFKSYYGKHEWVLPVEPGLYYITGKNRFNPRLGSNGIGKSTLTDAINWVLYGKTSRGLRAGDVISWGKSSCTATLTLQIGEIEYKVTRTQNPNGIFIDRNPATQDEVDKLIRLNQGALNNSMLLPQFGESFLDLSPSAKLVMFSKVMDLDYWLERSKAADNKVVQLAGEINSLINKGAHAKGSIERLRAAIVDLKVNSEKFDDDIKTEIKEQEWAIKHLSHLLKQQQTRSDELELVAQDTKKKREEVKLQYEGINKFLSIEERKVTELRTLIKSNNNRLFELESEFLNMGDLMIEKICPTCLQEVDKGHGEKHQSIITKKVDKLKAESTEYKNQLIKIQAVIDKGTDKYNECRRKYNNIDQHCNDLAGKIYELRNSISNAQNDIYNRNKIIEKLSNKTNPFEELIAANIAERKDLKKRIAKLNEEIYDLKMQHEANVYWIKGFKRVRLFVIEEALISLEVEVNNLLVTLGLVDWKITFDIERENKSGGVTKGFVVLIHSPRHKQPVRFESFSGGEVQRLRLAGDLGLSNLIMEQAGFENMVEIIDEPSEHLSAEGIEDFIVTIAGRAEDTGRQIWLIDHCSMDSTLFSGMLHCTMNKEGKAKFRYAGSSENNGGVLMRENENDRVDSRTGRQPSTVLG
jgi:DNA repair exonuclease SbcCD ATPase subunit